MNRKVEVLDYWESDYGDVRCRAILSENNKEVANVIISFINEDDEYYIYHINKVIMERRIESFFDEFKNLPKLSKCSPLLQEIVDNVMESEATMCHITEEDWKDFYQDKYSEKDLSRLKQEIKRYNLEDTIEVNNGEYKIIGYGDLETKFNDDRKFARTKELER